MLDLHFVRENFDQVRERLGARNFDPALLEDFQKLDAERRALIRERDELNAASNRISKEVGAFLAGVSLASTPFRDVVAHGMWAASLISAVLGTRLPGPGTTYLSQTLEFLAPVHVGDTPGGFFYSSYRFCLPEHGGTHLDAPVHFHEGGASADQVPLERLVGEACVLLNLSAIRLRRGRVGEAEALMRRALREGETAKDQELVAAAANNLGLLHSERGELDEFVARVRESGDAAYTIETSTCLPA